MVHKKTKILQRNYNLTQKKHTIGLYLLDIKKQFTDES